MNKDNPMQQPLIELGGRVDSPTLHIAIANGFVPETYIPLLRPFFDDYRVVSLPPRALWGDPNPPEVTPQSDWNHLADDILAGMEQYKIPQVVAIGHSFGAIASMKALMQQPERFKALIMLDPTILTPQICTMLESARQNNMAHHHPLAQGAMRRRQHFASAEEAYERFRAKKLFADWSDETVRHYAEAGTIPNPDGDGVVLRWSGAWEAYYFSTGATRIWDELPQFEKILQASDVPTLIINGSTSDTFLPESAQQVRDLVPSANYDTIEGHGHLFPQSAPQGTAERIRAWLAQQ
jgi:pimeloyl-ACP methyl ester carboxylesterase